MGLSQEGMLKQGSKVVGQLIPMDSNSISSRYWLMDSESIDTDCLRQRRTLLLGARVRC